MKCKTASDHLTHYGPISGAASVYYTCHVYVKLSPTENLKLNPTDPYYSDNT